MIDKNYFIKCCADFDITVSDYQADQFDLYASLLVEWNQKMNLTAITQPEEIIIKHFLDSLLLTKAVDLPKEASLIDVGTGAGFPAIPVKILRNDVKVTLLDSQQKRLNFLQEVCSQGKLNCNFVHARAEDGGKDKALREKFDFATARAVAHLRELSEYCIPYLKVGGCFMALKGFEVEDELAEAKNAISTMGGKLRNIVKFDLPDQSKRSIVVIKKISQTPPQFPRTAAKIAKKPILAVGKPSSTAESVNGK